MAITTLSIPTRTGGTSSGYPADINLLTAKINELAAAMSIPALTIAAAVGAGDPAGDMNQVVSKLNVLVSTFNATEGHRAFIGVPDNSLGWGNMASDRADPNGYPNPDTTGPSSFCWPAQVAADLSLNSFALPLYNAARPGATVADYLNLQWPKIRDAFAASGRASMVLAVGGAENPIINNQAVTNQQIASDYTTLINAVQAWASANGKTIYVLIRSTLPANRDFSAVVSGGPTIAQYAARIASWNAYGAANFASLGALNWVNLTSDARLADPTNTVYTSSVDNQHKTNAGYRAMSDVLVRYFVASQQGIRLTVEADYVASTSSSGSGSTTTPAENATQYPAGARNAVLALDSGGNIIAGSQGLNPGGNHLVYTNFTGTAPQAGNPGDFNNPGAINFVMPASQDAWVAWFFEDASCILTAVGVSTQPITTGLFQMQGGAYIFQTATPNIAGIYNYGTAATRNSISTGQWVRLFRVGSSGALILQVASVGQAWGNEVVLQFASTATLALAIDIDRGQPGRIRSLCAGGLVAAG